MREREVVVAAAVRTPVGRYGGALAHVRPDDLAAHAIAAILERTGVDPARIDDVYFGAANQSGEDNRNVARMAVLLAGLPVEIPGATINRLCGSSLQAINSAAHAIAWGDANVAIAGGVESMTRAPFVQLKAEKPFDRSQPAYDTTIGWRMINPRMQQLYPPITLGQTADNVAERYGISREEQDRFAYQSQMRAKDAVARGAFHDELVPVGDVVADEHPRPETTLEALAALKPAFKRDGTVTAGNSSGINDGAAALLLAEAKTAERLGLQPLARVLASATAGVHPDVMGLGPIPATRKALAHAGLRVDEIDLVEINEAFAAQVIPSARALGVDPLSDKLNPHGGAIALGHPFGMTGARILCTLLNGLASDNRTIGLETMCVGGGQGMAMIVERLT